MSLVAEYKRGGGGCQCLTGFRINCFNGISGFVYLYQGNSLNLLSSTGNRWCLQGAGDFFRNLVYFDISHAAVVVLGTLLLVTGGTVEI